MHNKTLGMLSEPHRAAWADGLLFDIVKSVPVREALLPDLITAQLDGWQLYEVA